MKGKDIKKTIWGLAKGLSLNKNELYDILFRETKKDSMRACTDKELLKVVQALVVIKEKTRSRPGMASKAQLWRIRELEGDLDWKDNPKRLLGFVKKYYKVDRLDWLKSKEAEKLIESLKKLLEKAPQGGAEDK